MIEMENTEKIKTDTRPILIFKNCRKCCHMFPKEKEKCPDCKIPLDPVYEIEHE